MNKLPFEIVSHERRQGRVKLNLRVNEFLSIQAGPATTIADVIAQAETMISQARTQNEQEVGDSIARLSEMYRASHAAPQATPDFQTLDELKPKDTDYIFPLFRALSATTVEGYWLDYSTPGVLQAAVPLLQNQTVYADHVYWRVADWVGVVQESTWDAKGEQSGGDPGHQREAENRLEKESVDRARADDDAAGNSLGERDGPFPRTTSRIRSSRSRTASGTCSVKKSTARWCG